MGEHDIDVDPALLKKGSDAAEDVLVALVQACHKIQQNLVANAEGHKMTETAGEMRMSEISKAFE